MATMGDVRRLALGLPDVAADGLSYRVNRRLICWPWMERVDPRKARVANLEVLVVRTASELDKHALIEMDPLVFFTEPHYDGYAAILVRLASVDESLLAKLIYDAAALARQKPPARRQPPVRRR